MAGIITFTKKISVLTLFYQYFFTLGRLRRHKLTKPLAAQLETLRPKLDAALAEELNLTAAEYEALAAVLFADDDLDDSVDFVTGNLSRTSVLYGRLMGDQRRSDLKKPILAGQLATMASWPSALAEVQNNVILKDHAAVVADRVKAGDLAAEEKNTVAQKFADFRTVGTRGKLVDEFNALRKSIYGQLGQIQHDNQLKAGWAESFFQQDSAEEMTLSELDKKIAGLEVQLTALKTQREEQAKQEEKLARDKEAAERRETQAQLAAVQKTQAELKEKEAALKAKLGEAPPEPEPEPPPEPENK
jgi:hypothetical protein